MPTTQNRVPVSERALLARVNRRLATDGQTIKRCRQQSRWHGELGDFYLVNTRANRIDAMHLDLSETAQGLGLLKPYERSVSPPNKHR